MSQIILDDQLFDLEVLRHLLRLPEFRTKAVRMDRVARVSSTYIEYWQFGEEQVHRLSWPKASA